MNVRIRGIYATALTRRFRAAGHDVVQATDPIQGRFDAEFGDGPADLAVETSRDRQGVGLYGDADSVEAGRELLGVERDTFRWPDPTPFGSIHAGVVEDTGGGAATVALGGGRTGYLPFSESDDYVEEGDRLRVQVSEPTPPWDDDDPRLSTTIRAPTPGGMAALVEDGRGIDAPNEETAGLVDLLSLDLPEGWGIELGSGARGASLAALERALRDAAALAEELDDDRGDGADASDEPERSAAPYAGAWCWFGRESRFALDDDRREATTTMPGHHRIKAGSDRASDAVDFVEALPGCEPEGFPFDAVAGRFGPREGHTLAIEHGKPDGRLITLGRGEVIDYDPEGSVRVRREMTPGGTYDALGVERDAGDVAVTTLTEGRWWYPTVYKDEAGRRKGTYVNVCTPVELFPDAARYVDLYVDVVRHGDGRVERVDSDELEEATAAGLVGEELAEKARGVASSIERALS
jgi:probable ribonuclease FAU-1